MPTNLPVEAQKKLAEYQLARRVEDKIRVLEEALSLIPDHKGTEKMRRQIKTTLAKLRRELEAKKSAKVSRQDLFNVRKEGDAQITLLGVANSGKSTILSTLTSAKPQIEAYQLTTTKPVPGMLLYNDVELQVVELPAILTEELEETAFTTRSIALARNSDLIAIVLDGAGDLVEQFRKITYLLEEYGIVLKRKRAEVIIEKKDSGGVRLVVLGSFDGTQQDVKNLLHGLGIKHAVVKIYGDATLDDVEEQVIREATYKRSLIVVGRADMIRDTEKALELKREASEYGLPVIPFTILRAEESSSRLKEQMFKSLEIIRIYTQKDGVVSSKPIVLPRGATVLQLAQAIHREFAEKLHYARVWGSSVRIQGQQVGPSHILEDGDTVEIHI